MIPNNNLSVLPWYTSIEQQNARKWWIYNRIYPLFTPAGFLLPFQLIRDHRTSEIQTRLYSDDGDNGYLTAQGDWKQDVTTGLWVDQFDNITGNKLYLSEVPAPYTGGVMAVAYGSSTTQVLGTFNPPVGQNESYTGVWNLPAGTRTVCVQVRNANAGEYSGEVYSFSEIVRPVEMLKIYTKTGELVGDYSGRIDEFGFAVKPFVAEGYDVIVYGGQLPRFPQMENGQYYIELGDGVQTWYSEVFTVVNDISGYLKLEWWDVEDFRMDAGTIVYKYTNGTQFRNVLYLQADIAKPEYPFEEEGETRDGYFFPIKQISEKHYRFSFLASEYLLDVMRFIRMADYAHIEKNGQIYNLDTFLITPDWEDNGDVAAVEAEFDTATVAKKIGRGYVQPTGDFNKDFNNDYS